MMGLRGTLAAICLWGLAAHSAGATGSVGYRFVWQGAGGYEMRGAMRFDRALAGKRLVTETDLQCFEITGYRDGVQIGRWALGMLTLDTSWRLTFDSLMQEFVVYGPGATMPQAWNMDGGGYDCGEGGFGFNIGSAAQDLCVDGQLAVESQVPPPRRFPALRDDEVRFSQDGCRSAELLGLLDE